MDFFSGVILALSPWLFNFEEIVYMPYLFFGIIEMTAALTKKLVPDKEELNQHGDNTPCIKINRSLVGEALSIKLSKLYLC